MKRETLVLTLILQKIFKILYILLELKRVYAGDILEGILKILFSKAIKTDKTNTNTF